MNYPTDFIYKAYSFPAFIGNLSLRTVQPPWGIGITAKRIYLSRFTNLSFVSDYDS